MQINRQLSAMFGYALLLLPSLVNNPNIKKKFS
jgi:hypothetical protein